MTVNAHDAEEQLRPYLGRLFDASHDGDSDALIGFHALEALDKALELLGVQR